MPTLMLAGAFAFVVILFVIRGTRCVRGGDAALEVVEGGVSGRTAAMLSPPLADTPVSCGAWSMVSSCRVFRFSSLPRQDGWADGPTSAAAAAAAARLSSY